MKLYLELVDFVNDWVDDLEDEATEAGEINTLAAFQTVVDEKLEGLNGRDK